MFWIIESDTGRPITEAATMREAFGLLDWLMLTYRLPYHISPAELVEPPVGVPAVA